ncbi:MAG: ATP synthase F0 subunit C [Lachnospiraceae bacterium]|nr:ATP synthase F0 subunit C [Lachnospiraceae bacterium]
MKKMITVLMMILMLTMTATMVGSVSAAAAEPASTDQAVAAVQDTEANGNDVLSTKAIAAAIVVAVVGAAGAIGMAMAISKSTESMARQPEMASKINSAMMLGIVFIETAIIYALIVAILIIFVL